MKCTILAVVLVSALAACGHGNHHDNNQTQPQTIKVENESDYLSQISRQYGVPFDMPFNYEVPIESWELKYLNVGIARANVEYKMVGESLKTELAAKMGGGVDHWIKQESGRCIADTDETFQVQYEWWMQQASVMCTGMAYGYWALVNGTGGTEGTPRQSLERGYCGLLFKQYDLSASSTQFVVPTEGLDNEDGSDTMMPSTTDQMGF